MIIEITCAFCGEKSHKPEREIKRIRKSGRNTFYCSRKCSALAHGSQRFPKTEKICPLCWVIFTASKFNTKSPKFCSQKCANTTVSRINAAKARASGRWIEQSQEQIRAKNKARMEARPLLDIICCMCGEQFKRQAKTIKTCSKECYSALLSKNATLNPNCGGETNYRKHKYKGVTMDSSWEVDIAKCMDSKGIIWQRSKKNYFLWTDNSGRKRRYHPDFYLPDYGVHLEPKNKFLLQRDAEKLARVQAENEITLICGTKDVIISWLNQLIPISETQ